MSDVISLSELSDEPRERDGAPGWTCCSRRLDAVLARLPGERVRISRVLDNMQIYAVAQLLATDDRTFMRAKNLGPRSREYIDAALACFGLHRVGQDPPVVVRDGAHPDEAHCQRLRKWIEERLAQCDVAAQDASDARLERISIEQEALADVMLILDGREPKNERRF